jgi:choline dehydrogenase-like flavoprotein
LETDLCVVGAGPAGLSLTAEFANTSTAVVLLESGSSDSDPAAESLNSAVVEGDPHAGLQVSRHRQVGGTACVWSTPLAPAHGARYVPLDPLDFRGERGRPPWPIQFVDLVPYYHRAQIVAGLGRFDYESHGWNRPPSPIPDDQPNLASRIYQFGPADRFCRELPAEIVGAPNITLCHGATAIHLRWQGNRVEALDAISTGGMRLTVKMRRLVLATGGVENARLLLVEADAGNYRDESGWLGRGFMEHPRDYSIKLKSTSRRLFERLEFFDARPSNGTTVCGRIALREEAILGQELPNASILLLPTGRAARPFHWRIESMAWRRLGWNLTWPPGFGWSRLPSSARRFDGFQLVVNLEEFPDPGNRLILDSERDRLGVQRVRLHRRWRQSDAARLARLRSLIARDLTGLGLGPLEIATPALPDPNSHHHLGATRMGTDEKTGVTDGYGQVFGTENLFVAGGSLFPAAGHANPTLTSIALSLRLADRLKESR